MKGDFVMGQRETKADDIQKNTRVPTKTVAINSMIYKINSQWSMTLEMRRQDVKKARNKKANRE